MLAGYVASVIVAAIGGYWLGRGHAGASRAAGSLPPHPPPSEPLTSFVPSAEEELA